MITLEEINANHKEYGFVETLLSHAFPFEERRDDDRQRANTLQEPAFHTLLIRIDSVAAGLLTYWDFGTFRYGEHFAMDASRRNGGKGAQAFKQFLAMAPTPVVLEVEPAGSNPMAERRIGFYNRLGLRLWTTPYLQPPYRQPGKPLPLCLMASEGLEEQKDFCHVASTIHRHVYGAEPLLNHE